MIGMIIRASDDDHAGSMANTAAGNHRSTTVACIGSRNEAPMRVIVWYERIAASGQ